MTDIVRALRNISHYDAKDRLVYIESMMIVFLEEEKRLANAREAVILYRDLGDLENTFCYITVQHDLVLCRQGFYRMLKERLNEFSKPIFT